MKTDTAYIIEEGPHAESVGYSPTLYVYAPPGWMREGGAIVRDGTPPTSGPEWGKDRTQAYRFRSHRAASRVLSRCGTRARIIDA